MSTRDLNRSRQLHLHYLVIRDLQKLMTGTVDEIMKLETIFD